MVPQSHGVVAQEGHEANHFPPLEVAEPHGALVLVAGVQEQHVGVGGSDLLDLGVSPRHAAVAIQGAAAAAATALAGVAAGLLYPPVDVVGVQERELEGGPGGVRQAQQRSELQPGAGRPA